MKSNFSACPSLKVRNLDNQLLSKIYPIFLFVEKKNVQYDSEGKICVSSCTTEGKLWNMEGWR